MILATIFTFIVERSWKNMYFHPKLRGLKLQILFFVLIGEKQK